MQHIFSEYIALLWSAGVDGLFSIDISPLWGGESGNQKPH